MGIYNDLIPKGTPAPAATTAPTPKEGFMSRAKKYLFGDNGPQAKPTPAVPAKPIVLANPKSIYADLVPKEIPGTPAIPAPARQQGIIPAAYNSVYHGLNNAIETVTGRPDYEKNPPSTSEFKNLIREIPGAITETILPGVKAIRDNPNEFADIQNKDVVSNIPGQTLEAGKEFAKGFITGGLNFTPVGKINVPFLGEVTSNQENARRRIDAGEDVSTVILSEGGSAVLNSLFFLGGAMRPFLGRPQAITKLGEVKVPGGGLPKEPGPRTGRLYEPKVVNKPITPEALRKIAADNNIPISKNWDPKNPTYFRVTGVDANNIAVGRFEQLRPSWASKFISLFKGDISKVPPQGLITIGEVKRPTDEIVKGTPIDVPPQKPISPAVVPGSKTGLDVPIIPPALPQTPTAIPPALPQTPTAIPQTPTSEGITPQPAPGTIGGKFNDLIPKPWTTTTTESPVPPVGGLSGKTNVPITTKTPGSSVPNAQNSVISTSGETIIPGVKVQLNTYKNGKQGEPHPKVWTVRDITPNKKGNPYIQLIDDKGELLGVNTGMIARIATTQKDIVAGTIKETPKSIEKKPEVVENVIKPRIEEAVKKPTFEPMGEEFGKKKLLKYGFGEEAMGFENSADIILVNGEPGIALNWFDRNTLGGFSVAEKFRGKGIATEYIRKLVEEGGGKLDVADPNDAMMKVLKKVGNVTVEKGTGTATVTIGEAKPSAKPQPLKPKIYSVDDGSIRQALVKKYGEKIPIYHGGIDLDLSKEQLQSSYLNRANVDGLYFTIGIPVYSGRGVMYRFDVPVDYLLKNAEPDPEDIDLNDKDFEDIFGVSADDIDSETRRWSAWMHQLDGNPNGLQVIFQDFSGEKPFKMPNEYFREKKSSALEKSKPQPLAPRTTTEAELAIPKGSRYYTYHTDTKGWEPVSGKSVLIDPALDTFISKGKEGYTVTELTSGAYMSTMPTKEAAIAKAKEAVATNGIDKVKELIAKTIADNGITEPAEGYFAAKQGKAAKAPVVAKPSTRPAPLSGKRITIKAEEQKKIQGVNVADIHRDGMLATPKQLISKSELKAFLKNLGKDSIDLDVVQKSNQKYLGYSDPKTSFYIKPSALGLLDDNMSYGDTVTIDAENLKPTGTSLRGYGDNGETLASLASDLKDGTFKPAMTPTELAQRIAQLNKVGQLRSILRRTGGLPKKDAGMFRHGARKTMKVPNRGIVHLQDKVVKNARNYMGTLAHELGHALEFTMTGTTRGKTRQVFGKNLSDEIWGKIKKELKAVTEDLVGKETAASAPGYYYMETELLARFLEKMFISPTTSGRRGGSLSGNIVELAPTAIEYFEKSAVENPLVSEYLEAVYGAIDKGERKHIFWRDMKQTYQKVLGTRVGEKVWNMETRYRAMKARSIIAVENLVKSKFQNVKDDPELLFRAAESIKVTKGGQPEFGTRDFQYPKNAEEHDNLLNDGYYNDGISVIEGKPNTRMAKDRYTKEEAQKIYEQLSPEGKQLINDFTAAKDEAKDYFNREMIKDVHGIKSELEGWVHHYWEEKGTFFGKNRLKVKTASAKKHRKGAEGYVEDLRKAMVKALTELETTKEYNAFIEDFFASVSKPIAKGQLPDPGWVEVTGNVKKGGIGTPMENKMSVMQNGKMVPIKQTRYQVPQVVYERYKMISELATEASTVAKVMNEINRYWRVNILTHPGSAATNLISGGLQYAAKVLNDFYLDALTGQITFKKTGHNLLSMLTVLTPKGWANAPDWMYGGDMSSYYGEFMTEKAPGIRGMNKGIDVYADKALRLYGAMERYWKKVIATAEGAGGLSRLNQIGRSGLPVPTEEENELLDLMNSEIDLYAYDYNNVAPSIQNFNQSGMAQAIKPFSKYPYKYAKQITEMFGKAFDQTLPWQERMASILALVSMISLAAYIMEKQNEKKKTEAVPVGAPPQVSTQGRLYVGTDQNGKEMYTRTSKYPFMNLASMGTSAARGDLPQALNVVQDMIGTVAPVGDIAMALMGYSNQYQTYTPMPVRVGSALSSYIPGGRLLTDISKLFDPFQRRQTTFGQTFTSLLPLPGASEETLANMRGEKRTISVPVEGGVYKQPGDKKTRTTTDIDLVNNKVDILLGLIGGLYVNRIDPNQANAFVIRKAKTDAKKK